MKIKTVEKPKAKKTSKKKTTKKKVKKKSDTNCNLWVTDVNGELDRVSMKPEYRMQFVQEFGVERIPTKEEFESWYSTVYLK